MFAGHIGVALGAWSFRRTLPLWLVLLATEAPDWADASLCLANVDRGPAGLYTHGLFVVAGLAVVLALAIYVVQRDLVGAMIVATIVASHYALDLFTGTKPTWPGGPTIGLGLYSHPVIDAALEIVVVGVGWMLYRRTLPADRRRAREAYAMLGGLVALQLAADIVFYVQFGGKIKC